MKRLLLILFGVLPILSGCHRQELISVSHLVTGITITRLADGETHHYTQDHAMGRILNYLRSLDPFGKTEADPVISPEDYQITLHFSDGRQRSYWQQNREKFLDADNRWKQIHPEDARQLSLLFAAIPSEEETAVSTL